MAGGRYDGLVRMFAQEGTSSDKGGGVGGGGGAADGASTVGAVGMNIAVEKIVTGITQHSATLPSTLPISLRLHPSNTIV